MSVPDFDDLDVFFADFALDATWTPAGGSAQAGKVILDAPDAMVLGDMVISTETTLVFKSAQWSGIDEGQTVVIGSASYRLRQRPQAFDDGQLVRVEVAKL